MEDLKEFLVFDKSGRCDSAYPLNSLHIKKYWDLEEEDDDSEISLSEYLEDCTIGDEWNTNEVKIICSKT
jgi:hypothetical protein